MPSYVWHLPQQMSLNSAPSRKWGQNVILLAKMAVCQIDVLILFSATIWFVKLHVNLEVVPLWSGCTSVCYFLFPFKVQNTRWYKNNLFFLMRLSSSHDSSFNWDFDQPIVTQVAVSLTGYMLGNWNVIHVIGVSSIAWHKEIKGRRR